MATNTSIVALFDDIVASTNILTAGTEGSESFSLWEPFYYACVCRRRNGCYAYYIHNVCLYGVLASFKWFCLCLHTVFAQFVSSQMGVNRQLHEMAEENVGLKVRKTNSSIITIAN